MDSVIKSARIKFEKLMAETPKAFLISVKGKEYWIPKSQSKKMIVNKKLGGNVVLPSFVLNAIIGVDINEVDCSDFIIPEWVVKHHEPKKITVNEVRSDTSSLLR